MSGRLTSDRHSALSDVVPCKWEQGHVSGPLQGDRESPLMSGTGASLAAWLDLAAIGKVAAKPADVLVIDVVDLVDTESADLSARGVAGLAAALRATTARSGSPGAARWSGARSGRSLCRLSHLCAISLVSAARCLREAGPLKGQNGMESMSCPPASSAPASPASLRLLVSRMIMSLAVISSSVRFRPSWPSHVLVRSLPST